MDKFKKEIWFGSHDIRLLPNTPQFIYFTHKYYKMFEFAPILTPTLITVNGIKDFTEGIKEVVVSPSLGMSYKDLRLDTIIHGRLEINRSNCIDVKKYLCNKNIEIINNLLSDEEIIHYRKYFKKLAHLK